MIVTDNGSEFSNRAVDAWVYARGVKIDYIQPGKPMQNGIVESFNGALRDECLNLHWFVTLRDAREKIERGRDDYSLVRPHSALGNLPPRGVRRGARGGRDYPRHIHRGYPTLTGSKPGVTSGDPAGTTTREKGHMSASVGGRGSGRWQESVVGVPPPVLDPRKIEATALALQERIESRFPGSGIGRIAGDLHGVTAHTVERIAWVERPHWAVRAAGSVLLGLGLLGAGALFGKARSLSSTLADGGLSELLQGVDAGLNVVLLLGAAGYFLVSLEGRIKRRRALRFLRELRGLAHLIDLHQLRKDPSRAVEVRENGEQPMSQQDVSRYLDFCGDMLALVGKVAALYGQRLDDPAVLGAVDEVESLTVGLNQKIWHKIMVVERIVGETAVR